MSTPQQPRLPVHAPPAAAQQRKVPTTSTQPLPPAQQPGAASPGAQTTASPSVQGASRHEPPRHTRPPQQSAPWAHGSPLTLQHRPPSHRRAPQHPASLAHCAPVPPQQRFCPARSAQMSPPLQHATAPGVHVAPSATEHAGGRHTPPVHVSPVQQSEALAHVSADVRHTQRPAAQLSRPQHSAELAHAPSAARQHDPAQASPPQHAAALEQVVPTAPHDEARAQRPAAQARPATHGVVPAQHA